MTLGTIACQAPLSSSISQSLLRFMTIESVMLSNHLILYCPLLLLPSVFPSITERLFFPMNRLFTSGSQSVGTSASASVQFSRSVMSNSLQPHELQHSRPPCPSPTPRVYPNSRPLWVGDAIQPPHPLSSPSPPALNLSQHQGLFKWVSSSHQAAKVLEFQLQHQSFQWTPRSDLFSQESCPTPKLKSINSWALSLLSGPTLTSIHEYWKNCSFD